MSKKWVEELRGAVGDGSETYTAILPGDTSGAWREALAVGNGWMAVLESGDPTENVIIYQDTRFVLGTNQPHTVADISECLDQERKNVITREKLELWAQCAEKEYEQKYGVQGGITGRNFYRPYPYHPGAQLRIRYEGNEEVHQYRNYTNYETGETGFAWENEKGQTRRSRTFVSRKDNCAFTKIEACGEKKLELTLGLDHIYEMAVEAFVKMQEMGMEQFPETQEIVLCNDYECSMGQCGKYAPMHIGGMASNPLTKNSAGGWVTAFRIYTDGKVKQSRYVRDIFISENFTPDGKAYVKRHVASERLQIKDAGTVVILAVTGRQEEGLSNLQDVRTHLYRKMQEKLQELEDSYRKDGMVDYEEALAQHVPLHRSVLENAFLELCTSEEEKKDRNLTNEELIEKQRMQDRPNKAYLERLFQHGRFALACSCGYHVPRMSGIWNGSWLPQFDGDFTMNANLNMQIAAMNIGNQREAGVSYIWFVLRQLPDWEINAEKIMGMTDAIKAPCHISDGRDAQFYSSPAGWPHVYWNASAHWLLFPIYEFYQCFGDCCIPLGEDLELDRLEKTLHWKHSSRERIEKEGFQLLADILQPSVRKLIHFWMQYMAPEFYTDEEEKLHLKDGTTIREAGENAKFLFVPGYSPENAPGGIGYNRADCLAANVVMDLAAAKHSFEMARTIWEELKLPGREKEFEEWAALEKQIPGYCYTGDGTLKEWALSCFEENYNHRHVSHTYPAWPCFETKKDRKLANGVLLALEKRTRYNTEDEVQAHGHLQKGYAAARIGNGKMVQELLYVLMNSGYHYRNLLTSHDKYHNCAFNTDNAIGLPGIVLEALVYSDKDTIELLPALCPDWEKGSVGGIRTRCGVEIETLTWNKEKDHVECRIIGHTQKKEIIVSYEERSRNIQIDDGERITVQF